MKGITKTKFIGGRVLKTGIAALITALVCHVLDWPAMFAVITAIVTIEPTAADSIKKAFVRFPASALGAGYAVLFTYVFGDSPLAYGLVTFFTIITCSKLKLHDGTLVATLTGVAMISTVHHEYITSFFIRLGTTSIGLVVSSIVNIFLIPPKYTNTIVEGINHLFDKALNLLEMQLNILFNARESDKNVLVEFEKLKQEVLKMERLCHYQFLEWRFHRYTHKEMRKVRYEFKRLSVLRQMIYHIDNLFHLKDKGLDLPNKTKKIVMEIVQIQKELIYNQSTKENEKSKKLINELTECFYKQKNNALEDYSESVEISLHITTELTLLYEFLLIQNLIEEQSQIQQLEQRQNEIQIQL